MNYQNPSQVSNFYTRLGVSSSASLDEIKTRYRALAFQWHPDRNPGSKDALRAMQALSEAYTTLSDPTKRRTYDLKIWSRPNNRPSDQQRGPNTNWRPTPSDLDEFLRNMAREAQAEQRRQAERMRKEANARAEAARKEAERLRKEAEARVEAARKETERLRKEAEARVEAARKETERLRKKAQFEKDLKEGRTFDIPDLEQRLNENFEIKTPRHDYFYNEYKTHIPFINLYKKNKDFF